MITASNWRNRFIVTRLKLVELESRLAPGQTGLGDVAALSLLGPALAGLQLDGLAALPRGRLTQGQLPIGLTPQHSVADVPVVVLTNRTTAEPNVSPVSDSTSVTPPNMRPPSDFGTRTTVVGPNIQTNSSETCSGTKGLIQSETTVAYYQNVVVVGYNDSRGLSCPGQGFQITGWSFSLNRGRNWTDGGSLPGGTQLVGDPWLTAGPTGTIYLSSLRSGGGLAVLRGTIAPTGINWSNPVTLTGGSSDKEAIAVDPNNGNNVYVVYTRFSGGCGIWLHKSTDAGVTFTGPIPVNSSCGTTLIGAVPIVGNNSELYVVYGVGYPSEVAVGFARSFDGGQTFENFPNIAPLGDFPPPSGMERAPGNPHISIDRSGGHNHGSLYITYHSDHLSGNNNGDAVFIRSIDNGATWSTPTKINDDGGAALQWFPTISVDSVGFLHSFFYDRRLNPGTNVTDLYYARSTDAGHTWEPNVRVTSQSFPMQTGTEFSTTWGDYINATTQGKGAMVAYADGRNGNPDTFFTRVGNRD